MEKKSQRAFLICEDEGDLLDLICDTLKEFGTQLLSAKNGTEAYDMFLANKDSIDLVITDITMPGMDGFSLSEKIREEREDLNIIFISGFSDKKAPAPKGESHNFYLDKPFFGTQLTDAVKKALV